MAETPITPTSGQGQHIPAPQSGKAVIAREVPNLSLLSQYKTINATVVKQAPNGNTLIKINDISGAKIELNVNSKIILNSGSTLDLKIITNTLNKPQTSAPTADSFKAQIVKINGFPPPNPINNPQTNIASPPSTSKSSSNFDIIKLSPESYTKPQTNISTTQQNSQSQPSATAKTANTAINLSLSKSAYIEATVINPSTDAGKYLSQKTKTTPPNLQISDKLQLHITSITQRAPQNPQNSTTKSAQILVQPQNPAQNAQHIASYKNLLPTNNIPAEQQALQKINPQSKATLQQNATQSPTNQNQQHPSQQAIATSISANKITSNQTIQATVIGFEKSGEAIIRSDIGTLKIPITSSMNLTNGTKLSLEVISLQANNIANATASIISPKESLKLNFALEKAVIDQLFQTLRAFDAELNINITQKIFPKASLSENEKNQFIAKIFWFLGGVKSGNTDIWLGRDINKILEKHGKKDLANNISKALGQLKAAFAETSQSGWNTMMFPINNGEKLDYGMFYTRREKKKHSGDNDSDEVRFVVELELDEIGKMQMDGFVKQKDHVKSKSFDLVIRSKSHFSHEMKNSMIDIFTDSNELTGIEGSLQFQVCNSFPINPSIDESNPHDGGIIA